MENTNEYLSESAIHFKSQVGENVVKHDAELCDNCDVFLLCTNGGNPSSRVKNIFSACSPTDKSQAMNILVHLLMIECGFVSDDVYNQAPISWKDNVSIFFYKHKSLSEFTCSLVLVSMGDFKKVLASFPKQQREISVQLDTGNYIQAKTGQSVCSESLVHIPQLSLTLRNCFMCPLMVAARESLGLPVLWQLTSLPKKLLFHIAFYLDARSVLNLSQACQTLYITYLDKKLWQELFVRDFPCYHYNNSENMNWKFIYRYYHKQKISTVYVNRIVISRLTELDFPMEVAVHALKETGDKGVKEALSWIEKSLKELCSIKFKNNKKRSKKSCIGKNNDAAVNKNVKHNSLKGLINGCVPSNTSQAVFFLVQLTMIEGGFIAEEDNQAPNNWKERISTVSYNYKELPEFNCTLVLMSIGDFRQILACFPEQQREISIKYNCGDYIEAQACQSERFESENLALIMRDRIVYPLQLAAYETLGIPAPWQLSGMPHEMMLVVIAYLDVRSILNLSQTCQRFNTTCSYQEIWKQLYKKDFFILFKMLTHMDDWTAKYKESYMFCRAWENIFETWTFGKRQRAQHMHSTGVELDSPEKFKDIVIQTKNSLRNMKVMNESMLNYYLHDST